MPQFARCGEGPSVRCHGLLKGCNSIGTVNLKVPLLILKPCPSLDIQLRSGVVREPLKGYTHKDS